MINLPPMRVVRCNAAAKCLSSAAHAYFTPARCLDVTAGATPLLSLADNNADPQLWMGNVAFSLASRADIVRSRPPD